MTKMRHAARAGLLNILALLVVCTLPLEARAATTVVWVSVDGLSPKYLDRADTPFFDRLAAEGAFTRQLAPSFPSLTFPSHVSQATGVPVARHGVSGNTFFDTATGELYRYPWDAALMQAEPIWLTASRQGVRTAVWDWPLSHAQRGTVRAEYFGSRFIPTLSDRERVDALLDAWRHDLEHRANEPPLRLLMGYIVGPDAAGHQFGPDAQEPLEQTMAADALLRHLHDEALALWERRRTPADDFVFLVTTDHGMSPVHTLVNLERLIDADSHGPAIKTLALGSIGQVFLTKDTGEETRKEIERRLAAYRFVRVYAREALPPEWGYAHPTRVGDLVVVLDPGYAFSHRVPGVTADAASVGGPLGMHGYHPAVNEDMHGALFIWRASRPWGGVDLGQVDALQLHATVASLLGIEPAPDARRDPVRLSE